jgi:hypothetical protein
MPETISKTDNRQIIGGMFSERENADQAVQDLRELGIPGHPSRRFPQRQASQRGLHGLPGRKGRGGIASSLLRQSRT